MKALEFNHHRELADETGNLLEIVVVVLIDCACEPLDALAIAHQSERRWLDGKSLQILFHRSHSRVVARFLDSSVSCPPQLTASLGFDHRGAHRRCDGNVWKQPRRTAPARPDARAEAVYIPSF